ncbi:HIT domain-containing protein [Candidatus Pacearchaeota archaeon]|nr:HIT domain-containing protein [Candidatus Pacearchaeota archaeon]
MPFSPEEAEEIKKELIEQVKKIPNADHEQIINYIEKLEPESLEDFIKKNKIQLEEASQHPEKPIFQSIVENQIPSYKIDENKKALAILEIAPFSKGHALIIPKQKTSIEKISKSAFSLAQKISKKIKKKLKPLDIKMETFSLQDYPAINIIPIYKDTPLKKEKAKEEDLKELQRKLQLKKRTTKKISIKKDNVKEMPDKIPEFY